MDVQMIRARKRELHNYSMTVLIHPLSCLTFNIKKAMGLLQKK